MARSSAWSKDAGCTPSSAYASSIRGLSVVYRRAAPAGSIDAAAAAMLSYRSAASWIHEQLTVSLDHLKRALRPHRAQVPRRRRSLDDVRDDDDEVADESIGREPGHHRRVRADFAHELAHDRIGVRERRQVDSIRLGSQRTHGLFGRLGRLGGLRRGRWRRPTDVHEVDRYGRRHQGGARRDPDATRRLRQLRLPRLVGLQQLEVTDVGHVTSPHGPLEPSCPSYAGVVNRAVHQLSSSTAPRYGPCYN